MENEIQDVDLTNYEEEVTNDNSQPEVDVEKLKETNSKLYARAKQAEQELKALRSQSKQAESVTTNNTYVSREDLDLAILKTAKGYDESEIETLSTISKGKGISLIQAQEDELFKLLLDKKAAEKRASQAKLGTSRGSSSTQEQKVASMTREEHMAYVKSLMN